MHWNCEHWDIKVALKGRFFASIDPFSPEAFSQTRNITPSLRDIPHRLKFGSKPI